MADRNGEFLGGLGRTVTAAISASAVLGLGTFYFRQITDTTTANRAGNAATAELVGGLTERLARAETNLSALRERVAADETEQRLVDGALERKVSDLTATVSEYRSALAAGSRYTAEYAERDLGGLRERIERLERQYERDIDRFDDRLTYLERSTVR